MELLTKISTVAAITATLVAGNAYATCAIPDGDIVLRDGLSAEIVYDGSADRATDSGCYGELDLGLPAQMAIDPTNGELYFGNIVSNADDHIIIIDPDTRAARKFPFFGNGVGFNQDGSKLYFGLSNLMLGVWTRETDEYRKFTILPGVESVQVLADGTLLVANSDYGKNILGVDTVWEVNTGDGYYAAEMIFSEAGGNFKALDSMAVDGSRNIYTLTGQGKILIQKSDGTYEEGNSAPVATAGLMQGGLGSSPEGQVFSLDTASGEVFAYEEDGTQVLLAYGAALLQTGGATDGTISSDGDSIYVVTTQGKVLRIYATDGSSLATTMFQELGTTTISGTILNNAGDPVSGVTVSTRNKAIDSVTTDAAGMFSFTAPAGLYHVIARGTDFGDFNVQVAGDNAATVDLGISMESFIPDYVAPGLVAQVVATKSADSIEGSSDVSFDVEGNMYSLNHSNATITKTIIDQETREVTETFVAARGGGIDNAWAVAIGDDLNMYASSSNSGLMRLPPADPEDTILLTVDPDDPNIVRDENGTDRMVSYVTDIDGMAKLSDGTIMVTSGSGGSIIDGFPEGTTNSLISYNPSSGAQSLFSRGIPADGGDSIFNNPDVLKVDEVDQLYVTNRGGNTVRVLTSGVAEMIWPGDGVGYPNGLGSYTAVSPDYQGNVYFKGYDDNAYLKMLDPADDHNMLTVASGMYSGSGFGGFEFSSDATEVYVSEWDFVLRIYSADGRTIAENITSPPAGAQATTNNPASLSASDNAFAKFIPLTSSKPLERIIEEDAAWSKLPDLWFYESSEPDVDEGNSANNSSGGAVYWMLLILAGGLLLRRRR